MPRFYFNLQDHVSAPDEEGMELGCVAAARAEARNAAAEVIAELIRVGERIDLQDRIEVKDEERRIVFTLSFRELVKPTAEPRL